MLELLTLALLQIVTITTNPAAEGAAEGNDPVVSTSSAPAPVDHGSGGWIGK